jgi:hypothetical protein
MEKLCVWHSSVGPFYIVVSNGLYYPVYVGELLGSYISPQYAADDLADGHTAPPGSGLDTATLNIPYDLAEWEICAE